MKTILNIRNLREFGIEILTGEACAFGGRILCDVTEKGRKIFCEAFGLPADTKLNDAWNPGSEDDPHVGSVMLHIDHFEILAVVALFNRGYTLVATTHNAGVIGWANVTGQLDGIKSETEFRETVERIYNVKRYYSYLHGQPREGLRNVHAMTGRSE